MFAITERANNFRNFCIEHKEEVESLTGDDLAAKFGISKTSIIKISEAAGLKIQKKVRGRKTGYKVIYKPKTIEIFDPNPVGSIASLKNSFKDTSDTKCSIDILLDESGTILVNNLLLPFKNKNIKITIETK